MDSPEAQKIIAQLKVLMHSAEAVYLITALSRQDLFLNSDEFMDMDWQSRASNNEITFLLGLMVQKSISLDSVLSPYA